MWIGGGPSIGIGVNRLVNSTASADKVSRLWAATNFQRFHLIMMFGSHKLSCGKKVTINNPMN